MVTTKDITQWNNEFNRIPFIREGTSGKALQFMKLLMSIYNKNIFVLMAKNVFLNCGEQFKQK
jgi:hypothetical protein